MLIIFTSCLNKNFVEVVDMQTGEALKINANLDVEFISQIPTFSTYSVPTFMCFGRCRGLSISIVDIILDRS